MRNHPLRDPDPPNPPAGGMSPASSPPAPPAAAPEPQPQAEGMDLVGKDGKVYSFESRDQIAYLATAGLAALQSENEAADTPPSPPAPTGDGGEEPSNADVIARIEKMENATAEEKRQAAVAERRRQILGEIKTGLDDIPYLKGKDALRGRLEKLVKSDLADQPGKSIPTIIEENAKVLIGEHWENYIAEKKKSKDAGPAPAGGGPAAPTDSNAKRFTAEDLKSGKIRRHVTERLQSAHRASAGSPNFQ